MAKTIKEMFPPMPKLYTAEPISELINRYLDAGGEMVTLEEGVLGYGLTMLYGEGLKTIIITEVYLNEWSSGHKVRCYNVMPKKYEKMLDEWWKKQDEEE